MSRISVSLLCLVAGVYMYIPHLLHAQTGDAAYGYYEDALRFSRLNPFGTARTLSLGGATQALGADLTNASTNPAGLGLYRRSDLSLTLGQSVSNSTSNFLNQSIDASRQKFHIGQFGVGFYTGKEDFEPGVFRGGMFAINYSRQNLFDNRLMMQGVNKFIESGPNRNLNSIVDFYYNLAKDANVLPSEIKSGDYTLLDYDKARVGQAYDNYILDIFTDNQGDYISTNFPQKYDTRQQVRLQNLGRINQWDLSFGGNLNDKFFFGAGMGIASIDFRQEVNYNETIGRVYDSYPTPEETAYFQRFQGVSINNAKTLNLSGTGLNLKLGILANLTNDVRWGASIQTPTRYVLNENFKEDLSSSYNGLPYWGTSPPTLSNYKALTINYRFNYELRTPWRYSTGLSYIVPNFGMVTAEMDYLSYNKARVTSANDPLVADNSNIKANYRDAFNIRAGAEYRYDIFRVRVGGNYMTNPYTNSSIGNIWGLSGGAGFRMDDYYIDVSVNHTRMEGTYQFNEKFTPVSNFTVGVTSIMLTGGLVF